MERGTDTEEVQRHRQSKKFFPCLKHSTTHRAHLTQKFLRFLSLYKIHCYSWNIDQFVASIRSNRIKNSSNFLVSYLTKVFIRFIIMKWLSAVAVVLNLLLCVECGDNKREGQLKWFWSNISSECDIREDH